MEARMHFAPRIDLAGGESLHSLRNPEDPERPFEDARDVALRFQAAGARRIQVIDIDRATEAGDNDEALLAVLESVGLAVDVGGGVRSMRRIQELLDTGAKRIVLSTMGLLHRDWLKEVGLCFGGSVVQAVDLREGRAWIKGRREAAPVGYEAFLSEIDAFGLGAFVVQAFDGVADALTLSTLRALPHRLKTPVWIGGVPEIETDLAHWRSAGVEGVVLGREVYDGQLDLRQLEQRYNGGLSARAPSRSPPPR